MAKYQCKTQSAIPTDEGATTATAKSAGGRLGNSATRQQNKAIGGCRNTPLPAPFTYRETAAPAFLYRHAPFLLLGFMFQLIARHLLHTLNIIVVESFTTPHHYCPMSVQPLPALTVTNKN